MQHVWAGPALPGAFLCRAESRPCTAGTSCTPSAEHGGTQGLLSFCIMRKAPINLCLFHFPKQQRRRGKGNEGLYQVGTTSHSCSPHLSPSGWICNGTVREAQRSDRQLGVSQADTRCLTNSSLLEAPAIPALGSQEHRAQLPYPSRLAGKGLGSLEGLSGDASWSQNHLRSHCQFAYPDMHPTSLPDQREVQSL